MTKTIVGLDLGHGLIRAAEVQPEHGRHPATLVRYHEIPVSYDAIREGVVVDEDAVVAALENLRGTAGFGTKDVVLGIGGQQVLIRELLVPAMPLPALRETLPFRAAELLPLPVEHAVLDFYPVEEVEDAEGPMLRGLLVAATKESVVSNIRAAKRAGFKVLDVDLIPFAIIRAQPLADRGGVKLFVHVGATSTSVVVTAKGIPQFVRMLPNGGNDLTTALVDSLGLRADRADDMKRRYGIKSDPADPQSEFVARVNAEGARDIVQAARSTVAFYENAHPEGSRVDGVVLSGGGAQLRGLAGEIADVTGLPVVSARGDAGISIGSRIDETAMLAAGVTPAVAVGLALRSMA
ncbi:type IV pilus assembly protein PilM [uncultured Amnibacterium sp.]|uniref:type IV pilus assembly protein PilM n=1 Tax=uncultured Amnibacterium sp. TaxID=1631851 RepID=UPI0035C992CA